MADPTTVAAPKQIKQLIKNLPKAALPEMLSCVVKECVQKKVYGVRALSEIVAALEARYKGVKGSERKLNGQ